MKRTALACLLLSAPAMAQEAQIDTVTVNGSSLVGVWHGTLMHSQFWQSFLGALTRISPPAFGQTGDAFCRIVPTKDELEMSCFQFGGADRVTVEGDHVRIGTSQMAFEGELTDSSHLRGHFRSRSWLGVSRENPAVAEAVRIVPQADAPDAGRKAPLLRRILEQGLDSVPQDADTMKKDGSIFVLPKLGAVQSLYYLGQETKWDWPPPPGIKPDFLHIPNRPDFFSVYFVRFAEGERLCGLHQRDDGVLDAFRCV